MLGMNEDAKVNQHENDQEDASYAASRFAEKSQSAHKDRCANHEKQLQQNEHPVFLAARTSGKIRISFQRHQHPFHRLAPFTVYCPPRLVTSFENLRIEAFARRTFHHQRADDKIMQALLALSKSDHDVADGEDQPGEDLREITADGTAQ